LDNYTIRYRTTKMVGEIVLRYDKLEDAYNVFNCIKAVEDNYNLELTQVLFRHEGN
jgi:hypothetical protein